MGLACGCGADGVHQLFDTVDSYDEFGDGVVQEHARLAVVVNVRLQCGLVGDPSGLEWVVVASLHDGTARITLASGDVSSAPDANPAFGIN